MTTLRIPIFIIVHDRVAVLKKSVASFESQIKTPIEIIFHDVASTFPGCINYLNTMKENGYRVYRSEKNNHYTVTNTINKYLTEHPECEYYVLTDPDIELDHVNGDILEFYVWLLNKYGKNLVVGPMLRIDDIPNYYPKKKLVIQRHSQQFWCKKPVQLVWKDKPVLIQRSHIDTTFQLVHRSNKKKYPRAGIRCYAPYAARHLDWYINPNNMTADQAYYSSRASRTAHWGRNVKSPTFKI